MHKKTQYVCMCASIQMSIFVVSGGWEGLEGEEKKKYLPLFPPILPILQFTSPPRDFSPPFPPSLLLLPIMFSLPYIVLN